MTRKRTVRRVVRDAALSQTSRLTAEFVSLEQLQHSSDQHHNRNRRMGSKKEGRLASPKGEANLACSFRAHRVSRNLFCVPIIVLALVMSALTWPMDSAQATARARAYVPRHHTDALHRPAAGTTGVR